METARCSRIQGFAERWRDFYRSKMELRGAFWALRKALLGWGGVLILEAPASRDADSSRRALVGKGSHVSAELARSAC